MEGNSSQGGPKGGAFPRSTLGFECAIMLYLLEARFVDGHCRQDQLCSPVRGRVSLAPAVASTCGFEVGTRLCSTLCV